MPARFLLTLFLFTLMCGTAYNSDVGQTPQPTPGTGGVPRELARFRAEHYRDVRYALNITLTPGADLLKGHEKIAVTLDRAWPSSRRTLDVSMISLPPPGIASRAFTVMFTTTCSICPGSALVNPSSSAHSAIPAGLT